MSCTLVKVLIALSLTIADAGVSGVVAGNGGVIHRSKESSEIHPTLVPESDKKFFGKGGDYPNDARPKVDVLHFKHPYPVVQDGDEFDRDYVKDENSDNGSWKAQSEYDRLRHKLAKEKADVAKALEAKTKAEKELQDATVREKDATEKRKHKEEEEKKKGSSMSGKEKNAHEMDHESAKEGKAPGGAASAGDIRIATDALRKAMEHLDDCKKQLAEAREKLKKLMEELDKAKKKQEETEAALQAAEDHLKPMAENQEGMDKDVKEEYKEYLEAKAAYEAQQKKLQKMEADLKVSAAKVKAMRDAEDRNGGVYNTHKDSAASGCASILVLLAAFIVQQ